jgi:LysM repeat protein
MDRQPGVALLAVALLVFSGCATRTTQPVRSNETSSPPIHRLPGADRIELDEQALPAGGEALVHTVRAGETLGEIAKRYRVGVAAICQLNRILDPDQIEVGQRLQLPRSAILSSRPLLPVEHPVEPTRAAALLIEAEELYLDARFERALEDAQEAESLLERKSDGNALRARAAFIAGSALAGLGEEQRASEQFARVLVLDPGFEPPTGWLSPRLDALYGRASAK